MTTCSDTTFSWHQFLLNPIFPWHPFLLASLSLDTSFSWQFWIMTSHSFDKSFSWHLSLGRQCPSPKCHAASPCHSQISGLMSKPLKCANHVWWLSMICYFWCSHVFSGSFSWKLRPQRPGWNLAHKSKQRHKGTKGGASNHRTSIKLLIFSVGSWGEYT